MRILLLTNNPNFGASARVLPGWLTRMRQRGDEVYVVAQARGPLTDWLDEYGFEWVLDDMPHPDRMRPMRTFYHGLRVVSWARWRQIDLIHCHEHNLWSFAAMLRWMLHRPALCYVHYQLPRRFSEWAFAGARCPDALLWTSRQQQADSAVAVTGLVPASQQHLLPLGIDVNAFGAFESQGHALRKSWELRDDPVVIGAANALRPRKRVHEFVELIARLTDQGLPIVGVIAGGKVAGNEAYAAKIKHQIDEAGLNDHVRMLGGLDQIEPFMHAIDLFVSTSEYETFGMSVLEAMACGRAVAAYRGGSVAEVVGDAGRIVETGDLDALVCEVSQLVTEPKHRQVLGQRAITRAREQFDAEASLARLTDIYQQIIQGNEHADRTAA